jgi:hypothetical protein
MNSQRPFAVAAMSPSFHHGIGRDVRVEACPMCNRNRFSHR